MKVKVSEVSGIVLDWMVAKCEGLDYNRLDGLGWSSDVFNPSTDWAQGGPIIEREEISLEYGRADFRAAWIAYKLGLPHEDNPECGPTPLVAAMRCFVSSKLGDEVEVPDELN